MSFRNLLPEYEFDTPDDAFAYVEQEFGRVHNARKDDFTTSVVEIAADVLLLHIEEKQEQGA